MLDNIAYVMYNVFMDSIKNKKLVLKGPAILTLSPHAENVFQLSKRCGVMYATLHRYVKNSKQVKGIDLTTFGSMLSAGLGLDDDSIKDLRIGDLFEIIDV